MGFDEAEEDEDEELGHAETYAEYMPPKCEICSVAKVFVLVHIDTQNVSCYIV